MHLFLLSTDLRNDSTKTVDTIIFWGSPNVDFYCPQIDHLLLSLCHNTYCSLEKKWDKKLGSSDILHSGRGHNILLELVVLNQEIV